MRRLWFGLRPVHAFAESTSGQPSAVATTQARRGHNLFGVAQRALVSVLHPLSGDRTVGRHVTQSRLQNHATHCIFCNEVKAWVDGGLHQCPSSCRSRREHKTYNNEAACQGQAWADDLHWPQGNLFTTMTVDNARMRLVATMAVTFAGSSLCILLRVYARGRLAGWVSSDWLNGRSGFLKIFTAAANMGIVLSYVSRRCPARVPSPSADVGEGFRGGILDPGLYRLESRPRKGSKL